MFSFLPIAIDLTAIAQDQPAPGSLDLASAKLSCCKFAYFPLLSAEGTILCDTATGSPRPFVSVNHKHSIFDSLHSLSHPGIATLGKFITVQF